MISRREFIIAELLRRNGNTNADIARRCNCARAYVSMVDGELKAMDFIPVTILLDKPTAKRLARKAVDGLHAEVLRMVETCLTRKE